jgi:hypothetical protein
MDRFAGVGICEPSFVLCNIGEKKGVTHGFRSTQSRSCNHGALLRRACGFVFVKREGCRKEKRKEKKKKAQDDKALLKKPICVGTLFEALVDTLILFFRLILSRNCGANEGAKSGWNECC